MTIPTAGKQGLKGENAGTYSQGGIGPIHRYQKSFSDSIQFSTGPNGPGAYNSLYFELTDIPLYKNLVAIYDYYRITEVKMVFYFSKVTNSASTPLFYSGEDFNNVNGWKTLNQALQSDNLVVHNMNDGKPFTVVMVPTINSYGMSASGTTIKGATVTEDRTWISTDRSVANPDAADYHAYNMFINTAAGASDIYVTVQLTYTLEFANVAQ